MHKFAMHCEFWAERGHSFGKAIFRFGNQPFAPFGKHVTHGHVQSQDRFVCQIGAELQGREPRAVQDFVRVGIPNAAQGLRIGEYAFERAGLLP